MATEEHEKADVRAGATAHAAGWSGSLMMGCYGVEAMVYANTKADVLRELSRVCLAAAAKEETDGEVANV